MRYVKNMHIEGNHSPYTQELKKRHKMKFLLSWGVQLCTAWNSLTLHFN